MGGSLPPEVDAVTRYTRVDTKGLLASGTWLSNVDRHHRYSRVKGSRRRIAVQYFTGGGVVL